MDTGHRYAALLPLLLLGPSCSNEAPDSGDYFNRFGLVESGASDLGPLLTGTDLEARAIEAIDGAEISVHAALEDLRSEPVASALVRAHLRGLDVKVVSDLDSRDQVGFRLLEAQAPNLPIRYGDGAIDYQPQPTTEVFRTGDMNRMTHNFLIVDGLRTLNLTGGFWEPDTDVLQMGFDALSEDISKDFGDEFDQMFGGVFSTTLDTYNGPLKSNTNPRTHYPTDNGVLEIYFGPQERLLKRTIDEIYSARGSVWVMTEQLDNRFLQEALEYKAMIGLDVRLLVADDDNDGILNQLDNCPTVSNVFQADTDDDGVGDLCDDCRAAADPNQRDSDLDGFGDACDDDDDNDGILDPFDNCPAVVNLDQRDFDGDSAGDACDPDGDGDNILTDGDDSGVPGDARCTGGTVSACDDNCPLVPNPDQKDDNRNGVGDACETDVDNDGVYDNLDNCPTVANPDQSNSDLDPLGNACDNCPSVTNPAQFDANNNGLGDACDSAGSPDSDSDGIPDITDNCPAVANPNQANSDNDPLGDACDDDDDNDGVGDASDNCPLASNPDQDDTDLDTAGDVCDDDDDNDGVPDATDNCPFVANPDQQNGDNDAAGDLCDNCLAVANDDQLDSDLDSAGDACDDDDDNDAIPDAADNCPTVANPDQDDFVNNGIGDDCALPEIRGSRNFRTTVIIIDAEGSPNLPQLRQRTRVIVLSQSLVESISFVTDANGSRPRPADSFMDSNMWVLNQYPNNEDPSVQRLIALFQLLSSEAEAGRTP